MSAQTADKAKKAHFNAVDGEHHRVFCDTGLEEKWSVSNRLAHDGQVDDTYKSTREHVDL